MATWPKTYRYLASCEDASADEALAAAARHLEGPYLRYAVEIMLQRAQYAGLLAVIENYHRLGADLKRLVLGNETALAPAMRTAIRDIELQTRVNCLEMASQMGSESLAYLFDLGLMDTQVKVRESAAQMMRQMACRLLADHPLLRLQRNGRGGERQTRRQGDRETGRQGEEQTRSNDNCNKGPAKAGTPNAPSDLQLSTSTNGAAPGEPAGRLALRRHQLVEVLLSSALKYEKHLRAEAVEACIWFEPYLGDRFWELLRQPRSHLPRLVSDLMMTSAEPPAAHLLAQAIAAPDFRPAALRAITERRDTRWFHGVLRGVEIWHACPKIRKAWGFIKEIRYLNTVDEDGWPQLARSFALPALVAASNLPDERKEELLTCLWSAGSADCRRQVLLEAGRNAEWGSGLLGTALCESQDPLEVRTAAYQLRRVKHDALAGDLAKRLSVPDDPIAAELSGLAIDEIFWRLWTRFDSMQEKQRVTALGVTRNFARHLRVRLRVNLASTSSSSRVRSVRMVGMLGLVEELWRDVLAVAQDRNPRPRSAAVRLLGRSDRSEMRSALRAALYDDDARVQANAIEAIEEAGWPDRLGLILPKLHSENNRIRANAARTLARAGDGKAAEVLSAMLQDPRSEHRMTAVWTIKAIGDKSWVERLHDLAEHDPAAVVRRFAQMVCRQIDKAPEEPARGDGASAEPVLTRQPAPQLASTPEPPPVGPSAVRPDVVPGLLSNRQPAPAGTEGQNQP